MMKIQIKFRRSVLSLVALFCALAASARAETLEQIQHKLHQQRHIVHRDMGNMYGPKWFVPSSNFYKIFAQKDGPENLLAWASLIAVGDFTPGNYEASRAYEYAEARKMFLTNDLERIELRILVPHPRFAMSRELGLLHPFSDMEPPGLEVLSTRELQVKGLRARLFERKVGGCTLVITLAKGALANFAVKTCEKRDLLVSLANKLDLTRLQSKLQS